MPEGVVRRREDFDEVAELYDRARPGYPPELVSDLSGLAGLGAGSRVLEIGPGTGQLTLALADVGCRVVAVELGPRMAEVARRNLAGRPDVDVVRAEFESWALPAEPFDLVVAATSWHWLDPAARVARSVAALRPAGTLAVVRTRDVAGGTPGFVELAGSCYRRWLGPEATFELPEPSAVPVEQELDESPLLGPVTRRTYLRRITYTGAQYADLLATYSPNLALPEGTRSGLLRCLAGLVDTRFGGSIVQAFLTELQTATAA